MRILKYDSKSAQYYLHDFFGPNRVITQSEIDKAAERVPGIKIVADKCKTDPGTRQLFAY